MSETRRRTLQDYHDGDTISTAAYREVIATSPGERFRNEKAFQEYLRQIAEAHGWMYYHTLESRGSAEGYPDTHLVNGPHAVFTELKMPGKTARPSQVRWLNALQRSRRGEGQWVCLWYPTDEAAILAYMAAPAHYTPPGVWIPREET